MPASARRRRYPAFPRALAALLVAPLAACAGAPRAPARPPAVAVQWSDDGQVVVIASERDGTLALSAHGGERGELRWRAALRDAAEPVPLDLAVAPDGARAVVASGGELWLASHGEAAPTLWAGAPGAEAPSFAPDGLAVAFVRDGGLWVRELAATEARRLTADGTLVPRAAGQPLLTDFRQPARPPLPYAWSPDSRSLAYFGGAAGAPPRLWIVEVAAPEPRAVAAAESPAGELRRAQWRYDARGLAVESVNAGEPLRRLQLCHAEKLYCRELALARREAGREPRDDFRFLEDGFLWSGPDPERALARYDTLGRLRTFLLAPGERLAGIAALLEDSAEVVVRLAPRAEGDEAGSVVLLGLADGRRKSTVAASGDGTVVAADGARRWVRALPPAGTDGQLVLEALDGGRIAVLEPAAPGAATTPP